jgi:hypothetical protein
MDAARNVEHLVAERPILTTELQFDTGQSLTTVTNVRPRTARSPTKLRLFT